MTYQEFQIKILGKKLHSIKDGITDYLFRFNQLKAPFGGAFNNQIQRVNIFKALSESINFDCIVETGTFRGTTTDFFFQCTQLPIYSTENNSRYYFFSLFRFAFNPKIHIIKSDSGLFLQEFNKKMDREKKYYFYLDAHWYNDLPLLTELEIIFSNFSRCIVMIDDFQVPFDDGYTYDDYGEGNVLSLEYLSSIKKYNLSYFFPDDSSLETGAKRGCVVICNNYELYKYVSQTKFLREHKL